MTKTKRDEVEIKLIERHMTLETAKFILGIAIIFCVIGLIIIFSIYGIQYETTTLGLIATAGGFIASSSKIKTLKDLLNLK